MLTQRRLQELLHYNKDTGLFTRLVSKNGNNAQAGTVAGGMRFNGYVSITVDAHSYFSHRLAFLYVNGGTSQSTKSTTSMVYGTIIDGIIYGT